MLSLRRLAIPIVGIVIALVGIVIYSAGMETSFGWTAYAPLTSSTFVPNPSPNPVIGVVAILVGVALTLGYIGFRAGQRRPRVGAARRWWILMAGGLLLVAFVLDVAYSWREFGWASGEALVGTPGYYHQTVLSVLTGLELGGQIRLALLAAALGCIAAWVGGALGRRGPAEA